MSLLAGMKAVSIVERSASLRGSLIRGSLVLLFSPSLVGDLCHYINVKLNRSEEAPMFIYAQNELIVSKGSIIAGVYQEYREDDFFLYLAYYEENAYSDLSRSES